MRIGTWMMVCALISASVPAMAQERPENQGDTQYYEEELDAQPQSGSTSVPSYRVVYQSEPTNTRVGLGLGIGMPGFLAIQVFYQSFNAITEGLYMDFRLGGSVFSGKFAGRDQYGRMKTPLLEPGFETDFRIGYGTRNTEPRKAVIKDGNGNRFRGRIPDSFGVAPYIGWRGRWGYDMQALRLGIHVERDVDAEVVFADGRSGQSFQQWAVDFELFYALRGKAGKDQDGISTPADFGKKGQEGFGAAIGFDYYFNNFLFTRGEFGFAMPNRDYLNYDPDNDVSTGPRAHYSNKVNAADGFFFKLLLGFSYQFNIKNRARKEHAQNVEPISNGTSGSGDGEEELVPARNQQPNGGSSQSNHGQQRGNAAEQPEAEAVSDTRECNQNSDCDDGIFCNGEETCTGGICMPGRLEDDDIACTRTVCDEETQDIRYEPIHSLCGDGQFCNGSEKCDPDTGCVSGSAPPVNDNDSCTKDYCDESMNRLVNEPIPDCESSN